MSITSFLLNYRCCSVLCPFKVTFFWLPWWTEFFFQHPNPVKEGLAMEAELEAAGPECIVPGQMAPVRLLGLKVSFYIYFETNIICNVTLWIGGLVSIRWYEATCRYFVLRITIINDKKSNLVFFSLLAPLTTCHTDVIDVYWFL
jgi:hypothetical protein